MESNSRKQRPHKLNLPDHIETYLGEITRGWTHDKDSRRLPFQVIECQQGVVEGLTSYATLGLSNLELSGPTKTIRLELLLSCYTEGNPGSVPGLLQQLGLEAISAGAAYLAGEVVGPRGPLFPGSLLEAVTFLPPAHWPEEFGTWTDDNGAPVVFALVVPISVGEARFIRTQGRDAFEDKVIDEQVPIADLYRDRFVAS